MNWFMDLLQIVIIIGSSLVGFVVILAFLLNLVVHEFWGSYLFRVKIEKGSIPVDHSADSDNVTSNDSTED